LTVLVDTNVILDVVTDDPVWATWSLGKLNGLSAIGDLAINDVIFAELAPGFDRFEELDELVEAMGLVVLPFSRDDLYLAGRAHHRYRQNDGTKQGVLPDFFIGAQAAVSELPLLTRDVRRFRTYFPTLELITP
jgi:predicted nucleic acid-binding protein